MFHSQIMSGWEETALEVALFIDIFGGTFGGAVSGVVGAITVKRWISPGGEDKEVIQNGKRLYRCGICNEVGHNRRTCDYNNQCPNCGEDNPEEIFEHDDTYRCNSCQG